MRLIRMLGILGTITALISPLEGCGTVVNLTIGAGEMFSRVPPRTEVYGGILVDAQAVRKGWEWKTPDPQWMRIFSLIWIFDFPLSLVADTLTLPITIPVVLFREDNTAPSPE